MNALVLGAAGFIGRHIAKNLASKGFVVTGMDRNSFSRSADWGVRAFHSADLSPVSLTALGEGQNYDLIVNCAGSASVGHSLVKPAEDFDLNVRAWSDILEFARTKHPSAHVILLSSAAVYGESDSLPNRTAQLPRPVSPYGVHKYIAEQMAETYARNFRMRVSAIRFFSIFGEGLKRQLLWDALLKFDQSKPTFFGTGQERRDWLHVEDAASLVHAVAAYGLQGRPSTYSVFNGGSGVAVENHRLLSLLANLSSYREPFAFNDVVKAGDPKEYRADISESLALGWKPTVDLEIGLRRYVEWFKKERAL